MNRLSLLAKEGGESDEETGQQPVAASHTSRVMASCGADSRDWATLLSRHRCKAGRDLAPITFRRPSGPLSRSSPGADQQIRSS
jgi:hypothetical protein